MNLLCLRTVLLERLFRRLVNMSDKCKLINVKQHDLKVKWGDNMQEFRSFTCAVNEVPDYLNEFVKEGYVVKNFTMKDVAYGVAVVVELEKKLVLY